MSRRALRRFALAVAARVPPRGWRRLVHLWLDLQASRPPEPALRDLLEVDGLLARVLDRTAIRYGDGLHPKHRLMRYHDFFVERLEPGEKVLDVGCSLGAVAHSMASRAGARVTGIDLVPEHVEEARRRYAHPNLRFVLGNAVDGLPDGPFDTIVISNVLEHFDHRVAFLRSAQQRLAPRRWLIRLPMANRDWRVPLRGELGLPTYNDPDHRIEYTLPALAGELAAAGLRLTHAETAWGEVWAEAVPADTAPDTEAAR